MWSENADEKLVTPAILKKCRSPLTLEHFRGASCFAGLDLSSGGDLTTLALEFQWMERERPMYYGWSVSFMPRGGWRSTSGATWPHTTCGPMTAS